MYTMHVIDIINYDLIDILMHLIDKLITHKKPVMIKLTLTLLVVGHL